MATVQVKSVDNDSHRTKRASHCCDIGRVNGRLSPNVVERMLVKIFNVLLVRGNAYQQAGCPFVKYLFIYLSINLCLCLLPFCLWFVKGWFLFLVP